MARTIVALGIVALLTVTAAGTAIAADDSAAMEQHMLLMDQGNPGMNRMMELMGEGNAGMHRMMDALPLQMPPGHP